MPPDFVQTQSGPHTIVLYAVRHGEALHNICERQAKEQAEMEISRNKGSLSRIGSGSALKEAARQAALADPSLHDAPLSDAGKAGAVKARTTLTGLFAEGMAAPTLVLSSPLQRALQTTALIFPDHADVRGREELRERRTGLPCDERSEVTVISTRRSFAKMRFSLVPKGAASPGGRSSATTDAEATSPARSPVTSPENSVKEEKSDVRTRAGSVLDLLRHTYHAHAAVALVTHKGWLREFERGPLGRPCADEFGNCEVRAWTVSWSADGAVEVTRAYPHQMQEQRLSMMPGSSERLSAVTHAESSHV